LLQNLEDSVRKALADVQRCTDELRQEQEHAALKSGKKIIQKLEHRIHELESELEVEQKNKEEILKEVKRNDRKIKVKCAITSDEF